MMHSPPRRGKGWRPIDGSQIQSLEFVALCIKQCQGWGAPSAPDEADGAVSRYGDPAAARDLERVDLCSDPQGRVANESGRRDRE